MQLRLAFGLGIGVQIVSRMELCYTSAIRLLATCLGAMSDPMCRLDVKAANSAPGMYVLISYGNLRTSWEEVASMLAYTSSLQALPAVAG
jgi:hypothetical protein